LMKFLILKTKIQTANGAVSITNAGMIFFFHFRLKLSVTEIST
jgi:hypothetical protein